MAVVAVSDNAFQANIFDLPEALLINVFTFIKWISVIRAERVCRCWRAAILRNSSRIKFSVKIIVSMPNTNKAHIFISSNSRARQLVFSVVKNPLKWLSANAKCSLAEGNRHFLLDGVPASRGNCGKIIVYSKSNLDETIRAVLVTISRKCLAFRDMSLKGVPVTFFGSIFQTFDRTSAGGLKSLALEITKERNFEEGVVNLLERFGVERFSLTTASPVTLSSHFVKRLFECPLKELAIFNATFDVEEEYFPNFLRLQRLDAFCGIGFHLPFLSHWMQAAVQDEEFHYLRIKLEESFEDVRGYLRKYSHGSHGVNRASFEISTPNSKKPLYVEIASKDRGVTTDLTASRRRLGFQL